MIAVTITAWPLHAHESPEHSIRHLTEHIETDRSAKNLFQRAIAYRANGQLNKASEDLREAVKLAPKNIAYHWELCRIELASAKPAVALRSANQALQLSTTPEQRAASHILRAQAYYHSKRPKPALQSCQLAFKEVPKGEIEWFLLRSESQYALGQHQQRITDLATGYSLHHSAVLKAHWIDAMLDASDFKTALPLIESELAARRLKSTWLIKRARALKGLGREQEATTDLATAQKEITARLNPSRPDIFLLADQTYLHILTGNKAAAGECLGALKNQRAPRWLTSRLELILGGK